MRLAALALAVILAAAAPPVSPAQQTPASPAQQASASPAQQTAASSARQTPASSERQPSPDISVLARSGIVFPQRLGKFVRTGISSLEQGRIGAQYALPDDPAGATVDLFVRPVAEPVDEEFAATEATVRRLYSNIVLVRDLPAPAGLPLALGRLWKGSLGGEEVLTGMIISHRAGWRIKLRATVSADRGEELWADVDGLIRAFDWGAPRT